MRRSKKQLEVSGTVSFKKTDMEFLGNQRILLLEKIEEYGSISQAAKAAGISYKTAWDIINAVNNLSDKPLCIRTAGGKSGGGTSLTPEGKDVIRRYRIIEEEHEKYLANLEDKMVDVDINGLYRFLKRLSMKVSTRNTFAGTVDRIITGEVKSEVTLTLKGGDRVVSIITNDSVKSLGLDEGSDVYAIIKGNSVIIAPGHEEYKISTRNRFQGKVLNIVQGMIETEIDVEVDGGSNVISAAITNECARNLSLKIGAPVSVMFKASSVIIGAD
jgi:molybdate transport system regulatory protein